MFFETIRKIHKREHAGIGFVEKGLRVSKQSKETEQNKTKTNI